MSVAPPGRRPPMPGADGPAPAVPTVPAGRLWAPRRRRVLVPAVLAMLLLGGLAVLALRQDVRWIRVTSGSMAPTLPVGGRVAALEPGTAGGLRVGEIVVLRAPAGAETAGLQCAAPAQGAGFARPCGLPSGESGSGPGELLVKRIVAGPGQRLAVRAGRAIVDGRPDAAPGAGPCAIASVCDFPQPIVVPAGTWYLLGDNRAASDDSRFWGPVPSAAIVGVVVRCGVIGLGCTPLSG